MSTDEQRDAARALSLNGPSRRAFLRGTLALGTVAGAMVVAGVGSASTAGSAGVESNRGPVRAGSLNNGRDRAQLRARRVTYPPDSGVVNVRDFGAKGDGVTDDTDAIRAAITTSPHRDNMHQLTIYFPAGTYLVTDTLESKEGTTWRPYLTLQGEHRPTTIIKLADSTAGFGDPDTPKGVIMTASIPGACCSPIDNGNGNEAFENYIFDLTVDTGEGNPGAIGIDYIASNQGTVGNVLVRGQGAVGLGLIRPSSGPCLIQDVVVEGFDVGMKLSGAASCVTAEYLDLHKQTTAGLVNEGTSLSIRALVSDNKVPAVLNSQGLVALVDGNLVGGGSPTASAIENNGYIFVRNINSSGTYRSAISSRGTVVSGSQVSEYVSDPTLSLFDQSKLYSLDLPIQDAPEFYEPSANWADVTAYGAAPNQNVDSTDAIQAALDSGKSTIFFPAGIYLISRTLHVRGGVRKILGLCSFISVYGQDLNYPHSPPDPMIRLEGVHNPLIMESLNIRLGWIEHATHQTVSMVTVFGNSKYRANPHAGDLFMQDCGASLYRFVAGQHVWVRQFDTEQGDPSPTNLYLEGSEGARRIVNDGADLWILGLKNSEFPATVVETINGGRTEVVGGMMYPSRELPDTPNTKTAFVSEDSDVSLTFTVFVSSGSHNFMFPVLVGETRDGVSRNLLPTDAYPKGTNTGDFVPLYIGRGRPNP